MGSSKTIAQAVHHAIHTAVIDLEAVREPIDERVRFDIDALARVMRLSTRTADQYNAVVASCEEEMHQGIGARDLPWALAALRLRDHVTAPRAWIRQGPDGEIDIFRDS